jgi:hypothetical protein
MATKLKPKPTTRLSEVDRDALEHAIELARQESRGRRDQVDSMLKERDWQEVAEFCAYCARTTR